MRFLKYIYLDFQFHYWIISKALPVQFPTNKSYKASSGKVTEEWTDRVIFSEVCTKSELHGMSALFLLFSLWGQAKWRGYW